MDYLDGITRAYDRGMIKQHGQKQGDAWTVLPPHGGFHEENCRGLSPGTLSVMGAEFGVGNQYDPGDGVNTLDTYLGLGAGSGIAEGELHRLSPRTVIETVSHSPINPFLLPPLGKKIRDKLLRRPVRDRFIYLEEYLCMQGDPKEARFTQISTPFIWKQYLGEFPDKVRIPPMRYQMIHDSYGPWYHTTESAPIVRATMAALADTGVALIQSLGVRYSYRELVEQVRKFDAGAVVIFANPTVIARSSSNIASCMRGVNASWAHPEEQDFIPLENIHTNPNWTALLDAVGEFRRARTPSSK